jgi:hypothetical protein
MAAMAWPRARPNVLHPRQYGGINLERAYWEDWNMKQLLSALQGWLKRNKTEEVPTKEHENPRKRERN